MGSTHFNNSSMLKLCATKLFFQAITQPEEFRTVYPICLSGFHVPFRQQKVNNSCHGMFICDNVFHTSWNIYKVTKAAILQSIIQCVTPFPLPISPCKHSFNSCHLDSSRPHASWIQIRQLCMFCFTWFFSHLKRKLAICFKLLPNC